MLFVSRRVGERRNVNSRHVEKQDGRSTGNPESPRLRFAKREIEKSLAALEAVDAGQFDSAIRLIEAEDRLEDAREDAARWRRNYESLARILAATGDERSKLLDQALRQFVGEA